MNAPSSTSGGATDAQSNAQTNLYKFLTGQGQKNPLQPFESFGGDLSAAFSGGEQDILSQFFGGGQGGGDFDLIRNALGSNLQQDALGQAQLLLQPGLQRTIDQGVNSVNERFGSQGTLNSSNRALAVGDTVGNATGQVGSTLASLIPQLMQAQTGAAGALSGLTGQALGFASVPRLVQQQGLDRAFQEWLRTTPSGGPLQMLLALAGGTPGGGQNAFGTSGFADMLPALLGLGGQLGAAKISSQG